MKFINHRMKKRICLHEQIEIILEFIHSDDIQAYQRKIVDLFGLD